jgi:sarcosine oxidase subunit gamma
VTALLELASPLGGREVFGSATDAPAPLVIREVPFLTQVNLRGDANDARFAEAVRSVIGETLPTTPNRWTRAGTTSALWLGPTEWMLVDEPGRADALAAALREALTGTRRSVTDVSASRTVVEIAGPHARLVLAKGGSLDWHAASFGPGQCAQTLFAKARLIVQCVDERPAFRLFVLNSFAIYLAEWLADAAAECAAARALDTDRVAARLA